MTKLTKMGEARQGPPQPLSDEIFGPAVVVGQPVEVAPLVQRLTAANPSMMTGPGTNTYLVGERDIVVIDPGPNLGPHLDAIEATAATRHARVRWIILTHHHLDHAPGARPLAERTGAEVIAFGHPEGVEPDRQATEGFVLSGPDFALRALHTPGHASDHLCWLLDRRELLFSGDHVMQGSTVVIRPPDGDMTAYLASLRRLLALEPRLTAIAPGHGSMLANPTGVLESIICHRQEREERLLCALASSGPVSGGVLLAIVYSDISGPLLDVARYSLQAHLEKLVWDGHVCEVSPADGGCWELVR